MISVLYVDDEDVLLDIGAIYLEKTGDFTVDTAESALVALKKIQSTPYDAIVSDYQMPEINGIEFLKMLRASGNTTPFIIFTGKGREEVVIDAINHGADFYIQKGGQPGAQFAELAHKIRIAVERKQSVETLRETRDYLEKVIGFANAPIIVWDASLTITRFNRAVSLLTGIPVEEAVGKHIDILFPDATREDSLGLVGRIATQDQLEEVEIPIRQQSGEERTIIWNFASIKDPSGALIATIAHGRDITEWKRVLRELRDSREWLGLALRSAHAGNWDWDVRSGMLIWSPEFFELFGLAPDATPSFETWLAVLHPDDREPAMKKIEQSVNEKTHLWNEYRVILPGGNIRWIGSAGSTSYNEAGEPLRMNGICLDISGKKQAEEALRGSESRYRELFEHISSGVAVYEATAGGENFVFKSLNRAGERIDQVTREAVTGRPVTDVFPGIREMGLLEVFRRVWQTGVPEHHPVSAYRDSRIIGWRENYVYRLPSGEIIAVYDDVTEQKQAEAALQTANRNLTLLSSITRHDIVNQLMVLQGYLDLSKEFLHDPVKLGEFIGKEEQVARAIGHQIQFTREYQELGISEPGWYPIGESVSAGMTRLPVQRVRFGVDGPGCEVYADPLFSRVFFNLFDNALKYGGDGMTAIRVSWHESGETLVIVFEDDGAGISAADKGRVFEKGYGRNTGFGLFLAREVLGITGIAIRETGEPGKGARFEIVVPKGAYRCDTGGSPASG